MAGGRERERERERSYRKGLRTRYTLQRHTTSDLLPPTGTHLSIPHLITNSSVD
jgi:hypothetical protein